MARYCRVELTLEQHSNDSVAAMSDLVRRFITDEWGSTAVEYGLIAAGISVAIVTALQGIGSRLTATFDALQTSTS